MFPRDAAKTTITIYNYLADSHKRVTYKRTVIPDCVWKQDSEATYKATGTLNADTVKLLIPFRPDYFSVQHEGLFEGEGWTLQMGPELLGTYIVKGVCDFEFPPLELISEESNFFRLYVEPFERDNRYKRPKEIIEHFLGSRGLWYIETRC